MLMSWLISLLVTQRDGQKTRNPLVIKHKVSPENTIDQETYCRTRGARRFHDRHPIAVRLAAC